MKGVTMERAMLRAFDTVILESILYSPDVHAVVRVRITSIQLTLPHTKKVAANHIHYTRNTRYDNSTHDSEPSPIPTTKFGKRRKNGPTESEPEPMKEY